MKNRLASLRQWFVNRSLRVKLMCFSTALIVISTLLFLGIIYKVVSDEYRKQIEYSANLSYSQAYNYIQKTIRPLIYASDMVFFNRDVQNILHKNNKAVGNPNLAEQYRDMLTLQEIIRSASNQAEILQIRLYTNGETMYSGQDVYLSSMNHLKDLTAFHESLDQYYWVGPENVVLYPNEQPRRVVSLLRKIRNEDDYFEVIGAVRVTINADDLDDIISKSNITQQGVAYLINSNNEIICSSNYNRTLLLRLMDQDVVTVTTRPGLNWETIKLDNEPYMVKSQAVANTDWHMVALIPTSEIMEPSNQIGAIMLVVMLAIIGLAIIFAYWFSGWFTRRMRILAKNMSLARQGALDVSIESLDEDEVGMLYDSFNYMLSELKQYSLQQYENGKVLRSAELRTLQAQINPHFLYNTMDLINWEAQEHGVPEIADIARSLARFYKLGLKRGREVVSINDELEHVQAYVDIQNYRFESRIFLYIEVPGEIRKRPILKTILQPLVENSILHGMLERAGKQKGEIHITAREQDGDIYLSIQDNGMGMTPQQLDSLFTVAEPSDHGFGITNINTRLVLYYGEEYGLRFESQHGVGTTVTVRIPAREPEENQ